MLVKARASSPSIWISSAHRRRVRCSKSRAERPWRSGPTLRRSSEVKAAVEQALEVYKHIDILHNNVGILKLGGPVDLSEDDWELSLDTNLKGTFLTCKHALPHMEERGRDVVTNVS